MNKGRKNLWPVTEQKTSAPYDVGDRGVGDRKLTSPSHSLLRSRSLSLLRLPLTRVLDGNLKESWSIYGQHKKKVKTR